MPIIELTPEQQFNLEVWQRSAHNLDPETAAKMVVELMRQNMLQMNVIKDLMKRGL